MATAMQSNELPDKQMHEVHRITAEGAIDADGHILEPPDLWEEYLEEKYRDRALRITIDENGLEELEIGGERSQMSRHGFPSTLGAMGAPDLPDIKRNPERRYMQEAPYGSMDPQQRIELLDAEHLDAAVLYTTIGLLWEAELTDPELSQAYTRAYNRWICDFCSDSDGRLVPTAHLSLSDPDAAAVELSLDPPFVDWWTLFGFNTGGGPCRAWCVGAGACRGSGWWVVGGLSTAGLSGVRQVLV